MTNRENALIALKGGAPEAVPCFFSSCQIVIATPMQEGPPIMGSAGYDGYGVHQTPTESGGGMFTPTPTIPPVLTDITKWREQVKFPDYENWDWVTIATADKEMMHLDPENYVQDLYCANGLFERLHFLMGFEDAVCAILEEPEHAFDLVGAIADKKIEFARKVAQYYKPDVFTFLDDYAYKEGLFISPSTFREIFKPHLARVVKAVHETGMIYKQHCCGKMESLLDDFMEIGITAFDPVQPLNNIPAMKKKTLGKAGLMGGLDVQNIIDKHGVTEGEIRAEVRRCIDQYAEGGGYMIYGASLGMYNPSSYAPDGRLGIVIDECFKYGQH